MNHREAITEKPWINIWFTNICRCIFYRLQQTEW